MIDAAGFLAACRASSQAAYECFKDLLSRLDDPALRAGARRLLTELQAAFQHAPSAEEFGQAHHFTFEVLTTTGDDTEEGRLVLLQLPSIFAPEEWSFTFYEGLARYSAAEFRGRTVAELGCGNGWVSIALAKRCQPARMLGLDINPRAVVCARVNLYLNALDPAGSPRFDAEGNSLLDCVEFHVSDLLSVVRERGVVLDRIVGCIPQVLSPDPAATLRFVTENASDDFLYSLSNYCERQGFVEDQFGLGLIARALEEAVEVMKPSAKVILNMGGRPGHAVLARLFTRRGFHVRTVWQTKVVQAGDTDIDALVEIEKSSPHRFEFYMGLGGDEPISAKTAAAYAVAGGEITHALSVYEARVRAHDPVRKILRLLRRPGFEDARSALDLTFHDDALADEKISFLASLAENLEGLEAFPYEKTEGHIDLRRRLAEFLRSYWRVPLTAKSVFVCPGRQELVKNVLLLHRPALALVDRELARGLPARWLGAEPGNGRGDVCVLEAPRKADQLATLVERLGPQVVICGLADFEVKSTDAFERLVHACDRARARLYVDISPHFDLSSTATGNAVLARLAERPLPAHVGLFCGLVKNRVYSDLEICFLVSENATELEGLTHAAEFTYSRASAVAQWYYDRILFDLLSFQMRTARKEKIVPRLPVEERGREEARGLVGRAPQALEAFAHPAIATASWPIDRNTVRLDYGENELPAPRFLVSALFEAFARQNIHGAEIDVEAEVPAWLEERFGFGARIASACVVGGGVAPLFAVLAEECAASGGAFVFPTGAYGYFRATCNFFGVDVSVAETSADQAFKLTAKGLQKAVSARPGKRPWIYLNAPVVNPTGAVYSPEDLADLLQLAHTLGAVVVVDAVFSGLEFQASRARPELEALLDKLGSPLDFVVLGGLSKEFAGGGLRFGFASTRSPWLAALFRGQPVASPHATLRYAAKKILAAMARKDPALSADLAEQRGVLRARAEALRSTLEDCGWKVIKPEGGLFLVASPVAYAGKVFRYATLSGEKKKKKEVVLSATTLPEALFHTEGCLVNDDVWTGLPGYCRFVLSVKEETFRKGLAALRGFHARVSAGT